MDDKKIQAIRDGVTFSHRIGKVFFGLKTVKELVSRNFKGFVILSNDVSPRVLREASFLQKKGYNIYQIPIDKKTLGSWFGKGEVGVLFLPNHSLTFKIESLLKDFKKDFPPFSRGLKHKEVASLETKRIRGRTGNRLQKASSDIKGEFWSKRSRKYKGYRRPKTNYRPNSGGFKGSSSHRGTESGRTDQS